MTATAAILTLKDASHKPSLDAIMEAVLAEFRLPLAYVLGPMRWPEYVRARKIFSYIARVYGQEKWVSIAHALHRDHNTAWHGWSKVKANPARYEPHLTRIINRLYKQKVAA